MGRWILGLTLAAVTAAPAVAANRICAGDAEAGHARVDVLMQFDGPKEVSRWAKWTPPDDSGSEIPPLELTYAMTGDRLGQLRNARVLILVHTDHPVKSKAADITVRIDGAFWTRPWRMFAQLQAQDPKTKDKKKQVGFVGEVPVAFAGSGTEQAFNVDLLNSVPPADQVDVEVRGDADEVFVHSTYSRLDFAQRDGLLHQAFTAAALAALSPRTCAKIKD